MNKNKAKVISTPLLQAKITIREEDKDSNEEINKALEQIEWLEFYKGPHHNMKVRR